MMDDKEKRNHSKALFKGCRILRHPLRNFSELAHNLLYCPCFLFQKINDTKFRDAVYLPNS